MTRGRRRLLAAGMDRGTVVKQLVILAGLLFLSGLLGTGSYVVRELIAAFGLFSVAFAALILITIPCFLACDVAHGGAVWLRIRAPLWNRARRDWMVEFLYSLKEIAKQARTFHWRHLWQRWTHRIPNTAVPSTEID